MSSAVRTALSVAAVSYALVGALLLVAPAFFYATIPGVAASGPYNAHFLRDVGLAYVTLAFASAYGTRDLAVARLATLLGAGYLGGHALLHLIGETAADDLMAALREAPGVYLPAALALWLALGVNRRRPASVLPA